METTLWSRVLAAADPNHPDQRGALDFLVRTHWRPVYLLYRRLGARADEAPDLTQEFFAQILEGEVLRVADPERGRFRAFLRIAARNFLLHEWERRSARKRGGGTRTLSFDFEGAERLLEPAAPENPDRAFDREWALDLLQACVAQLESEMGGPLFNALRSAFALDGAAEVATHARIAADLALREQDVANFLFRARRRLREILRERVRASVSSETEVDDEIGNLFAVFGS